MADGVRVTLGGAPGSGWYEALAVHEDEAEAEELRRRDEADRQAALWLGGRR